jgi:hypothetical protein
MLSVSQSGHGDRRRRRWAAWKVRSGKSGKKACDHSCALQPD